MTKKQQGILLAAAVLAVILLFVFGRTTDKPVAIAATENHRPDDGHDHDASQGNEAALDFPTMLGIAKQKLNTQQRNRVTALENSLAAATNEQQKIQAYRRLAKFWKDSAGIFVPYAQYTADAAKLENSEKSLTFAAHLLLTELQGVDEPPLRLWMAREARTLFEKAYALNPDNDSTAVGLGSCYLFGAINQGEMPMKGINLMRQAAERNPNNAYAHYMLGVGAFMSAQWDKAIERFLNVLEIEPDNMEAMLRMADAYERSGKKTEAKQWFIRFTETVRRLEKEGKFRSNPDMMQQLENHIKSL